MTRKEKNEASNERLFAAIEEMLKETGYDGMTMRSICERADVAYSSVYHFFGSKEELMYQYCRRNIAATLEANPLPEGYSEGDYVDELIWPFYVYLLTLEKAGWEICAGLSMHSIDDLFWDLCEESYLRPKIEKYFANGTMVNRNAAVFSDEDMYRYMMSDMHIMLSGSILDWCKHMSRGEDCAPLHMSFSRVMNRFLLSWASPAYFARFSEFRVRGIFNANTKGLIKIIGF